MYIISYNYVLYYILYYNNNYTNIKYNLAAIKLQTKWLRKTKT